MTAKLNDVDPQAWLADVLSRIASHPAQRLAELLPWNWTPRLDPGTPDPVLAPSSRDHAALETASGVSACLAVGVR